MAEQATAMTHTSQRQDEYQTCISRFKPISHQDTSYLISWFSHIWIFLTID